MTKDSLIVEKFNNNNDDWFSDYLQGVDNLEFDDIFKDFDSKSIASGEDFDADLEEYLIELPRKTDAIQMNASERKYNLVKNAKKMDEKYIANSMDNGKLNRKRDSSWYNCRSFDDINSLAAVLCYCGAGNL